MGTISESRFIRVLSSLGLSGLDNLPLNDKQIFVLTNHYRHPEQKDLILWKQFEQDLESSFLSFILLFFNEKNKIIHFFVLVFTLNNLEKSPSIEVSSQTLYEIPTRGTGNLNEINPFNQEEFQQTIDKWKNQCQQRRIEINQTFQQFDRFFFFSFY